VARNRDLLAANFGKGPMAPLNWNLQAETTGRAALGPACDATLADLLRLPPGAQCAALADTRPLHRRLFAPLAPPDLPEAAGTYRGTPGTPLAAAPRAVFLAVWRPGLRQRDRCPPAAAVPAAMDALGARIGAVWDRAPQGDAAFDALADVTHGFLSVHPYLDGNGHIYRLMASVLAPRLGLAPRADWTLHPRPYDHLMSLCLQWYPDHPGLLSAYLRRWMA
jgi:fido (protein-threonine AMPylation protein)